MPPSVEMGDRSRLRGRKKQTLGQEEEHIKSLVLGISNWRSLLGTQVEMSVGCASQVLRGKTGLEMKSAALQYTDAALKPGSSQIP